MQMINSDIIRLIFAFAIAFLLSFATTPIVRVFAVKIGAVDLPDDKRRVHKGIVPRAGGLAIFYSFLITVLCFLNITQSIRGLLIGGIIISALGLVDDISNLKAVLKFVVQIVVALLVVWHGIRIDILNIPFLGWQISLGLWSIPVTVFWIVAVTNAINLIDGLDGLAVGISSISALTLVVVSLLVGDPVVAMLAVVLAGAGAGFIPYNISPAKIFMGDTGSTFLGFNLACLSIMGLFKLYTVMSFAVPLLIMALPLIDTTVAIMRRVLKGQSPMKPDRGHLHHKLVDKGFTQSQAVIVLYTISALLSLSSIVMMLGGKWRSLTLIVAVFFVICVGYYLLPDIMKTTIDLYLKKKEGNKSE